MHETQHRIRKLQSRVDEQGGGGGGADAWGGGAVGEGAPLAVLERKLHDARHRQRRLEARDLKRMDVGAFSPSYGSHAQPRARTRAPMRCAALHSTVMRATAMCPCAPRTNAPRVPAHPPPSLPRCAVAPALMALSAALDADVAVVARMAAAEGALLLEQPRDVVARLRLLQQVRRRRRQRGGGEAGGPPLLLPPTPPHSRHSLPETGASTAAGPAARACAARAHVCASCIPPPSARAPVALPLPPQALGLSREAALDLAAREPALMTM